MNPSSKPRAGARQAPRAAKEVDSRNQQTPNTDMQAEDAGTADSGASGRGSAVQGAMKRTSQKSDAHGSKR